MFSPGFFFTCQVKVSRYWIYVAGSPGAPKLITDKMPDAMSESQKIWQIECENARQNVRYVEMLDRLSEYIRMYAPGGEHTK